MSEDVTSSPTQDPASDRPATVPWPPILLVLAVSAAIVFARLMPLSWPGEDDAAARTVGYGFGIAGLVLIFWSALAFRQAQTTILPHEAATALVTTGPFRRFRNPIYLGDTLILLSLAEISHNVWFVITAFAFALLVTWLAILPEERHLEAKFGEAYLDYKAKSRRWI